VHPHEPFDPLLGRRMRAEQFTNPSDTRKRSHDEQMRGGRIGVERRPLNRRFDLRKRGRESASRAGYLRTSLIGHKFAGARNRRLNQHRGHRRNDRRGQ
jgi:hypothetical protein